MKKAATERTDGVRSRSAGGGKWAENAKKVLFRGNEAKNLLRKRSWLSQGLRKSCFLSAQDPLPSEKYGRESTPCGAFKAFEAGITLI
jgi:hypothetical protein